jgi:ZIP family zinc transporter
LFEEASVRALILALIAGMSTLIGAVVTVFTNRKSEKLLTISLGFTAGIMLSVSFTDLFPTANTFLKQAQGNRLGILLAVAFLVVGVILAASLDKLVPHQEYDETLGESPHNNLFRVGFVSMLAIGIHNFPEGIATFMAGYQDAALGISVAVAIALHNIPEGIAVAMPTFYATGSRRKAFKYTFLSGIAEPVGALLAFLVLRPFMSGFLLGAILALVTGIMIYISIEELIPSSRQYGHDREALVSTLIGICLMPLTHIV